MPKRQTADHDAIVALWEETQNASEVARRMGLHPNTVYAALRRHRGQCVICGASVALGRTYCPEHLAHVRERARRKTAERRRLGICALCDRRIESPSRMYCAEHRTAHIDSQAKYKAKRGTPKPGITSESQRERNIRKFYGPDAVTVWRRLGGCCALCGIHHRDKAVCIHHIDLDPTNNVEVNFTCLCTTCHKLVHLFAEHTDPRAVLAWMRATYPALDLT